MKCKWEEQSKDERGWRIYKCPRCGHITKPTPHDPSSVEKSCPAWPQASEGGEWAALVAKAAGVAGAARAPETPSAGGCCGQKTVEPQKVEKIVLPPLVARRPPA